MRRPRVPRLIGTLTLALCLGASVAPARAAPKDFVIYATRLGGDPESAKPYIAKFTAFIEEGLGWAKGSFMGVFFTERPAVQAYVKKTRPGLGVLEPALYLELRAAEKLTVIAQLESKDLVSSRLHLIVKDPAYKAVVDLKGKRLWTSLAEVPRYLSRVVLGGAVEAERHFALKQVGAALKGVRAVLRGKAEATLLDDAQLAAARQMPGGAALRAIHTSPPLAALPLVVFGKSLKPAEQKALVGLLTRMCGTPKGKPICAEMRITRFASPDAKRYSALEQAFEK